MDQVHRRAPDLEWVELYRRGLSTSRIAKFAHAGATTVRYHIRLAAQDEPSLRDEPRAALNTTTRISKSGLSNLADVVALHERERRLPSSSAAEARERALATWLSRRRQDVDSGTLAPVYRAGLRSVPGWERRTRKAKDEAQWEERHSGLIDYWAAGNDWPRHKNPATEEERLLGVWLQYQRTKLASGRLGPEKRARLDETMPGWPSGRTKGRKNRMF
jgi:hypothetical protein